MEQREAISRAGAMGLLAILSLPTKELLRAADRAVKHNRRRFKK